MSVRPEVTVRQSAIETLAVHARAGSTLATEALTQLAQATDESVRAAASRAIMGSLSRREAKRILRDVLAPDEQWRMYEVRP